PPASTETGATPEVLPPGPSTTEVTVDKGPQTGPLRPLAFMAAGIGVVGLATFAIAGSMARSTENDLESSCPNDHCPGDLTSKADEGRTQQTVANIGLAGGLLGAATSITLFVLDGHSEETHSARQRKIKLVASPWAAALRGAF